LAKSGEQVGFAVFEEELRWLEKAAGCSCGPCSRTGT